MTAELWIFGVNHRTAPLEARERLAFENGTAESALRDLLTLPGIEEAAIVSTCNRVEVLGVGGEEGRRAVPGFLGSRRGIEPREVENLSYAHTGREAVRHVFRVASSLDSMVVGEPQILGQLKQFYQLAADTQSAGAILHRVFHKAFSVAKRVRSETGIGARGVSVSSVAVDLASQIFESLDDKTAMVIGAGKMAELTVRHLRAKGVGAILCANRTFDRAVEIARQFDGTPVAFGDLPRYLALADVIVSSTGATDVLLSRDDIESVQRTRSDRPAFFIDLGVPRDLDPRIHDLDNVYLYDIDDLEGVLAENKDAREAEAVRAEAIVDLEVASFWQWFRHLDSVPTIRALHEKGAEIRRRELEKTLGALPELGTEERAAVESMADAIVKKILHDPILRLKTPEAVESDDVVAARRLFGLDDDE